MVSLKNVFLVLASAASAATAAAIGRRDVQACSSGKSPNCFCPLGTTLQQSTARCRIRAAADDVIAIIGSYHNTSWFGRTPDYVNGTDNEIGGSRTLTGHTLEGDAQFTETLFEYSDNKKGGFTMAYEMENGPVSYIDPDTGETGYYAGYWDYLETKALGSKLTQFDWRIYACFTPAELAGMEFFHGWALANVNAILMEQGLSTGMAQAPFTIESFHT
ncbi:hypothetical protein MKZ38_008534 [Zalerion maritima]|uniref:Uncharacterized protein n=1 Tax=Zalerion maritima TaxID=339359 RepID=A0AAD5RV87_9PEZI|nr:hypothetical protein MKZ38_008534 [Zalerion maritima]